MQVRCGGKRWNDQNWWCKSQDPTCLEIYTSTEREAGWAAAGKSARSLHKGNSPSLRFTSSQRPYEGLHVPKCSCSEKQINKFIRFSQNRTTCGGSEWILFCQDVVPFTIYPLVSIHAELPITKCPNSQTHRSICVGAATQGPTILTKDVIKTCFCDDSSMAAS